jgi:hypothetical protein
MKRQKIMLPINDQGLPDYIYMEYYARKIGVDTRVPVSD